MHLQSDVRHHDEIVAARIRKVVMYRSTVEELQNHAADLAFAVIVDPDKCLYATTPGDLTQPRTGHPQTTTRTRHQPGRRPTRPTSRFPDRRRRPRSRRHVMKGSLS
jgi:hypothetical protein